MDWLSLPEPRKNITLAFQDVSSAKLWLSEQPQAQPMHMLAALCLQIEAVDGALLDPRESIGLLNLLRKAALPALIAIEPRYLRKALPMQEEDQRAFELAQRIWLRLAVAYMRLAPHFPPEEKCLPLHRAAGALRQAQYCHYQAARECPVLIDRLLFGLLAQAEASGVLRQALPDPEFPHLGEANIAGHLAWAFLLRLLDPYRWSAAQLTVANRAISRWRELTGFQVEPDREAGARVVDLAPLYKGQLPEGVPRWLEIRKVLRKIRQRVEALEAGEGPEALKLGRELSGAACIRLLRDISDRLSSPDGRRSTEVGEIELAFGGEHAYAVLKGEYLNPAAGLDKHSAALSHQRMAIFGFDRPSEMPTAVKKQNVPGEVWTLVDGRAVRASAKEDARRLSPCLIAANRGGKPQLGVLTGLRIDEAGSLNAELRWYTQRIEACCLKRLTAADMHLPKVPAFLLLEHDGPPSLILPANAGARLEFGLVLDGATFAHVVPTEVLERGVDFVRYAVRKA